MWMPSRPQWRISSWVHSFAPQSRPAAARRAAVRKKSKWQAPSTHTSDRPRPASASFERYLSLWVALCMVAGILHRQAACPALTAGLRGLEFGNGSQINAPIAVLIWLMITPMMMKVDFSSIKNVGRRPAGLLVTLLVNWVIKPFSMALLAWAFFRIVFAPFISPAEADQYIAGCIILAAAPCTAMVFVWSHLTNGDPAYTLGSGFGERLDHAGAVCAHRAVPRAWRVIPDRAFQVLLTSVIVFIVVPLLAGTLLARPCLMKRGGRAWFEGELLPKFAPVTIAALLATLVLIFAFQADNITGRLSHVLLIAIPITLQVYFNAGITYGLMKWLKVEHSVAAPGALIGASNFFELAVATAIALFGPGSGAALATVVGVLVEVPVMLSVCAACNRTRHWFPEPTV